MAGNSMEGKSIGRYLIQSRIGEGGMGSVYHATSGGQPFALKLIRPELIERPRARRRFIREAEIGERIRHQNVARTIEHGVDIIDGIPRDYLVMEYVEGVNLKELQRCQRFLAEPLCRQIAADVARGLEAIHSAGAIHRDLRPENILLTHDQQIRIVDFGVAWTGTDETKLSAAGGFVGSARYTSPEQILELGDDLDGRADLFAFGITLYELASGSHPFPGLTAFSVMDGICNEEPPPLRETNEEISPFFEGVVHCLLEKNREQRFASATALLEVLQNGENSTWWQSRTREVRTRTRLPLRRIQVPRDTALIGREPELARLDGLFRQACRGEGQVILIEGESGIGKSRLVDEWVQALRSEGEDFRFLFGCNPPGGAATPAGALATAYREHFGDADLTNTVADHLPTTPLLAPAFAAFLRGDPVPAGQEALSRDSLQSAFAHTLRSIAAEHPTVVLVEDLHNAPGEGLALFASLAHYVAELRVVLIGSSRPSLPPSWSATIAGLTHASRIELHRLDTGEVCRLLFGLLGSRDVAEELAPTLVNLTEGNPRYIIETVRWLRQRGDLRLGPNGTWVAATTIRDFQLPDALRHVIRSRIEALTEEEQGLLEVAACCGFQFDGRLVAKVLEMNAIPVLQAFSRLQMTHRLVRAAGNLFAFDHHQIQEAVLQRLSPALRTECHAAIAKHLQAADPTPCGAEAYRLADHFLRGDLGGNAIPHLGRALTYLEQSHLVDAAIDLAERALAAPEALRGEARIALLLRLAGRLEYTGRRDQQLAACKEASKLAAAANNPRTTIATSIALGTAMLRLSRLEEAAAALGVAVATAEEIGDSHTCAHALLILGVLDQAASRPTEAREAMERSLGCYLKVKDRRGAAGVTINLGALQWAKGELGEARKRFEHAMEEFNLLSDLRGEAVAAGNLGGVLCAQGHLEEAYVTYERERNLCRKIGNRRGQANATGNLGTVLLALGRLQDAREIIDHHVDLCRELGDRQCEAYRLANLASLRLAEGEDENAGGFLRAVVGLSQDIADPRHRCHAHLACGAHCAASGSEAEGRQMLVVARDLADEGGFVGFGVLARCHLATLPGGDRAEAARSLEAAEGRLAADEHRHAHLLLYQATRDRTHLAQACQLLEEALALVSEGSRSNMLEFVPLNRAIVETAREAGFP